MDMSAATAAPLSVPHVDSAERIWIVPAEVPVAANPAHLIGVRKVALLGGDAPNGRQACSHRVHHARHHPLFFLPRHTYEYHFIAVISWRTSAVPACVTLVRAADAAGGGSVRTARAVRQSRSSRDWSQTPYTSTHLPELGRKALIHRQIRLLQHLKVCLRIVCATMTRVFGDGRHTWSPAEQH